MAKDYDAVVIGAGHNGLACAAYLARAGRSVVVLERRDVVGGATVTEEHYPGFKYSACSYVVSLLRPQVISELDLPRHGLEILPLDGTMTPMPDGDYLMRWHDSSETRRELERHSVADADAYSQFGTLLYHLAHAVRPILATTPPDPTSLKPSQIKRLLDVGRRFGRSREHLYDLAKADDHELGRFRRSLVRDRGAARHPVGQRHHRHLPRSALAGLGLRHAPSLHGRARRSIRAWGFPRGGMSGVAEAFAGAARAAGAEIRTEASVDEILISGGRARGVVLSGGEEIHARTVVSSVDPKLTFERLTAPEHLDEDFRQQVAR